MAADKPAATNYIATLLNDAATIPIDADVNTYEIHHPPWFDENKFKRGQKFYHANLTGAINGALTGLISILAIPSILDVLIFTGQSSTPVTAFKRYVLTILHTLNWYSHDLKPGTDSWKSLAYVRRIHASSGKAANRKDPKMMVSQKDMAITQFGFLGFVILNPQKLGIQYVREDFEGFIHFWRTIGYMLGIEDRFNLCTDNLETTRQQMQLVNDQLLRPALQSPSSDFVFMTKTMIDGLWAFSNFLEYDAYMFLTRRICNVPGHYYWDSDERDGSPAVYKQLGWHSRFMLAFLMTVNEVLLFIAPFRWWFNLQTVINTKIVNRYFPVLAMIKYGIKNAYVRVFY
ncbi:uncharacterized protein LOC129749649 isoform X2 [Uranotaenia lowii]|uniref:uncharacterized protein LOC129749649 isoform X2 n=1 Tax=Uranotaenia lowii TaxID=190385 RepID=UPI002478491D|nr:uncharacterized protein LOC129749649 isoform X2 [Uranotaenia lowii]